MTFPSYEEILVHTCVEIKEDKIEEIIAIANINFESLEIVVKFYNLTEMQQQLTIVTLIEHNMVETLRALLLTNYDVNFLIRGQAPLHFAIKDQNLNMIKILIKYKADMEFKDKFKDELKAKYSTAFFMEPWRGLGNDYP